MFYDIQKFKNSINLRPCKKCGIEYHFLHQPRDLCAVCFKGLLELDIEQYARMTVGEALGRLEYTGAQLGAPNAELRGRAEGEAPAREPSKL